MLEAAAPAGVTLILTSPRVAPGLLTRDAWHVLDAAAQVLVGDLAEPLAEAVIASGVPVEAAPEDRAGLARRLINAGATASVVWLVGSDGDDQLYGGDGQDKLFPDAGADLVDGGNGPDVVSFLYSPTGVVADLVNFADNTGWAAGDRYYNVEDLIGSNLNDSLRGDAGANVIEGGAGDDWLYGRGGNDRLVGGDGNDTFVDDSGNDLMYGGAGNDRFVFWRFFGGDDVINDFQAGPGSGDQIVIRTDPASYGLPASYGIGSFADVLKHAIQITPKLGFTFDAIFIQRWNYRPTNTDTMMADGQMCRTVVVPLQTGAACAGTVDNPRIAACSDTTGQWVPCDTVGVEPVGAELISPVDPTIASAPDPSVDPLEPDAEANNDPATDPTGTIAPPSAPATVPPAGATTAVPTTAVPTTATGG